MHFARKLSLPRACLIAIFLLGGKLSIFAAEVTDGRALFLKGNYDGSLAMARENLAATSWDDDWTQLLVKSQLALGKYPEAQKTVEKSLERRRITIPMRLLAYDVFRFNGQAHQAATMLEELNQLAASRLRSPSLDPASLVALGRTALLLNLDPKLVLENFFDQAKRIDPNFRDAWLASGELALDKHDYALAGKVFTDALKKFPDDPDLQFGLAQAYEPSDRAQMATLLDAVLASNPYHVPAMALLANHLIDAEKYADAEKMLTRALKVNPWSPEAWAYRAVLAYLHNDSPAENAARESGLKYWPTNPGVDYLIGQKLAQKYRFHEAAAHQQQALAFDPDFLPAQIELVQDWLRLGREDEGWRLAAQVHEHDGYDVTAYNLVTLHETMAKFKTLTNQDFIVRMDAREAQIYGDRALALLQQAKDRLSEKYSCSLDQATTVEIFTEQKDFAVRTFGMPQNPGYLGVCFGPVVTANSPAAESGTPSNWEAVLWHEFCHVITLGLTHNKMPRWLSEGISVYEERQANPTWGQSMSPRYREMVLGQDFVPIHELSGAFLAPKDSAHMQFAYFESELAVDYLVSHFGLDSLKQILKDLSAGVEINDALARHTVPMDKLEKDFAVFAQARANDLAPGLDWKKPDGTSSPLALVSPPASTTTAAADKPLSNNYFELLERAETALADKQWLSAKAPLKKLITLYPAQSGSDNAYVLLAAAHRGLSETNEEREVLTQLAALSDDVPDSYLRLMQLDQAANDWPGVRDNAERYLAVNPLVPKPYRYLARASEELGQTAEAVRSEQRVLLLDPPDPADIHYHLAKLLRKQGDASATKRQVLEALEEAPRFRDAQRLLLEMENHSGTP